MCRTRRSNAGSSPGCSPSWGLAEAPSGGREELFAAWRTFFERLASVATVGLVFEDIHWADDGLLDFIEHLLDWSRDQPIFVITLARPELLERRPGWGPTGGAPSRCASSRWPTPCVRCSTAWCRDFPMMSSTRSSRGPTASRCTPSRPSGCWSPTGASRAQTTERSTRPASSAISTFPTLHALVAARLDAPARDGRSLLQVASVLGQTFSETALAEVTGQSRDSLAAQVALLRRRELLTIETDPRSPARGQLSFVQALVREVAYSTLARRERRTWHLAAARYFESLGDEELAGVLATHHVAAWRAAPEGPEGDAAAAQARVSLHAAADRAESLGARRQAIDWLTTALEVTTDPAERAALLQRRGHTAWRRISARRQRTRWPRRSMPDGAGHTLERLDPSRSSSPRPSPPRRSAPHGSWWPRISMRPMRWRAIRSGRRRSRRYGRSPAQAAFAALQPKWRPSATATSPSRWPSVSGWTAPSRCA